MYIIYALIAFSILVLIHELGHFTLAKLNGVMVEQFSIGMGPKIIGIKGKETEYLIKALPIGGYVKMLGDDGASSDPRAFNNKKPLQKLSIVIAGPFMNLVLALVLFSIVGTMRGFSVPIISQTVSNQPAELAGLKQGDKVTRINNKKINTWLDFQVQVSQSMGSPLSVTYVRNGEVKNTVIKPIKDEKENRFLIGVYPTEISNPTALQAISYGFSEINSLTIQTFDVLKSLFKGKVSKDEIGGPISVIRITAQAAKAGIIYLMFLAGYISVQLGIFNIIPFPALDGGYIILFLFELITGKKVDENKVGFINYIGFALLMVLMVLVVIKDILYPIKL